jgi:peptidoglycan/LPS O-acetylase OafA/YrhL
MRVGNIGNRKRGFAAFTLGCRVEYVQILFRKVRVVPAPLYTTGTPAGAENHYPCSSAGKCPMTQKIPQLDGVRGIAILLVLIHNTASFPSLHLSAISSYGWMGVDLFFVLSGFLITGILLDAKQSDAYFKNFYARRCLRIWPLYYSLLIFMFLIVPYVRPADTHEIFEKSSPWWAYPLFLQNVFVPIPAQAAGPLGVTWSLAIEEQFYLVWPLFVRYFSSVQIKRIALAVILLSPSLRFYLSLHHVNIYSNFFCRLDGLMAGALLAVLVREQVFVAPKHIKLAWMSFFIAVSLTILAENLQARWFTFSMTSMGSVSLVYLSLFSQWKWVQSVFKNRFLTYTGMISYGLYLLHKIPFDVAKVIHLDQHPLVTVSATGLSSYLLAALSWTLLEKPFLKLKRFFDLKSASQVVAGSQVPSKRLS